MDRIPNSDDIANEIIRMQNEARAQGQKKIQINAGELHRRLGGYPGWNHRMPLVCHVMDSFLTSRDEIICAPTKGKGASKTNLYYL